MASLLGACSSTKKVAQSNRSVEELHSQLSFEKAESRLTELVLEAKKSGPKATEYLSSDLFLKANDASMRGDSLTSTFIYKYLVELNPEDIYLRKKFSVELIRQGKLLESKEHLAYAYSNSGEESAIGLVLAGLHTALNEHESAQKIYKGILKNSEDKEEACVFLSKSYALEKRYKDAHDQLIACETKMPKRAIFSYYRGKIALEEEKRKEAMAFFESALKRDSEYYQAVIGMGLLHEEREDFDKAAKLYKDFLNKNPENFQVLSRYVQILFMQGDYAAAVPYAETMSSLDPSDLNLKVRLGIIYSDMKRFKEAIAVFKGVLEVVPDSDKVLYYLGALYQQMEDYTESIAFYQKIPSSSQLYADTAIQISQILGALARVDYVEGAKRGQVDEFLVYTKEQMKNKEIAIELAVVMSSFYEAIEEYPKAIEVLSAYSSDEKFTESQVYYLASLYEKVRDHTKARALVYKILDKNPENPHALNFIGYSMVELNEDLAKAYEFISKAVSIRPDDGFIRDSLGWYYYKTGNFKQALVEIKKAAEFVKDDPVITKHLAMTYRELNMMAEAKKYYMEALKNCKMDSERADVIKSLEDLEKVRMPASEK